MKRFRWFPTKAIFDQESENISVDDICFILDRLRIYTRSTSFDFSNRPIYQGETSASDTAGTWTVNINGITELYDGLTVKVRLNKDQSADGYNTLNVNSLGANPVWFRFGIPLSSSYVLPLYSEVIMTYRTVASSSAITVGGTSYTRGWVISSTQPTVTAVNITNTDGGVLSGIVTNDLGQVISVSNKTLSGNDIPNLDWSKITTNKPTTISGYGITDAKIENGVITLGSNTITPVSSSVLADYAPLNSPALTGTPTAPTADSGTNTTQIATTAFVQTEIDAKISAADAMVYKGTIGDTGATIETMVLPNSTAKVGWTYKAVKDGDYTVGTGTGTGTTTVKCEVGDMIICLKKGSSSNYASWTVVQNNIDGAVIGPASSVANRVATFNGTTGKLIQDSGYTIETSVPSGAIFTDTKNTTGTTNKEATKLYLAGAETQDGNPQTYSNSKVYIGTDDSLYSNGARVITSVQTASGDHIDEVGTPSVTASTSGATTTFTFNYLKGATGSTGSNGTSAYWFTGTAVTGTGTGISAVVSGSKAGDMYLNTSNSNVYEATAADTWNYVANIKGANGSDGSAATISVGTVTTGSAGSSASITNSGTSSAAVFDFTIPRGDTGTRGSMVYWGTSITGTSTTPQVFSGSGITEALVNDMYINTSTLNVYQCTTAGDASTAEWKYIGCLKGTDGVTPTIQAADGSDIGTVGTPSVTASTSGTITTFTFHQLKGEPGQNATTTSVFDSSNNGLAPASSNDNKTSAETAQGKYYLCDDGKYRQLPANAFLNDDTNTATLQVGDTSTKKINTSETTASYIQFTGGTNKFTVTDGTNSFDVDITPSITNNVTGSGLTANKIVLGDGNSVVKTSSIGISTTNPSSSSDNTTIPTSQAVWGAIADGIAATDAMVYKGTIAGGSTGDYGALTVAADKGHTYKVTTAGKIDGVSVEVGDMIICNTDSTAAATSSDYATVAANWDFIHTNNDGGIVGPSSSTADHIVTFSDSTGKTVKDSGYTIATSVPSGAVFTDTKNTAGTTNSASTKLYIVGAETQGDNPQTYSNSSVYIGTDNCLYSNGSVVLTGHQTIKQDGVTGATVNRFGTCSTAASTAAKTVDITAGTFSLEAGVRVSVLFSNANTATSPTLSVNSSTAKNIFHNGSQITTGGDLSLLKGVCEFIYDGTQWHLLGNYIEFASTQTCEDIVDELI